MLTPNFSLSDFDFHLPVELIAQYPTKARAGSRLLVVDSLRQNFRHSYFPQLLDWLRPGDLLVFNDTQVIPARLYGFKESGGQFECLIERVLSSCQVLSQIGASKSPRPGARLYFYKKSHPQFAVGHGTAALSATVIEQKEDLFQLEFNSSLSVLEILQQWGHIPLPPYIDREPEELDQERYQTVYARYPGAVAAPTAGLHFDSSMLENIQALGVELAYITLHVGAGTFQPVRSNSLREHRMHSEMMHLSAEVCDAVRSCRLRGGRVIAVGTTVARCLETAAFQGELKPFSGETRLFIAPGFSFQVIDALLTNFHLPKSTLLMLVSAFGGYELIMRAYQEAVKQQYRFFSYGDVMLLI